MGSRNLEEKMEYQKFGNTYVLRIDKGEEVVETLKKFCGEQDIKLGTIQGLGAADDIVIGLFKTSTKEYLKTQITGDHELTSITGNISRMNGEVYLHIHATLTDDTYKAVGGHLTSAVISGTCELFITEVEGEVEREFDGGVGLNLFRF